MNSSQEFEEIKRIKSHGGKLYFIERISDGKWFHYTFKKKEYLPCTCIQCYPHGFPFKQFKDGWTNDPQESQGYLTKEDAENNAFNMFITDESLENLKITEHEFINPNKK